MRDPTTPSPTGCRARWTESDAAIPVAILAGRDLAPGRLPPAGGDQRLLSGYKGRDLRIRGRPLARVLADVLAAAGPFDPVYVIGPAGVYRELVPAATIVDADGSLGANVARAVSLMAARHPRDALAFVTCDIAPTASALAAVVEAYRRAAPCDLFYPLVRAPGDRARLGASGWKPVYTLAADPGPGTVRVLPGHLVIADPTALRLPLVYRALDVGYRTRNRSIAERRPHFVRAALATLLREDLAAALSLRPPTATWSVLATAARATRGLETGTLGVRELEEVLRVVFARAGHRTRHPARRVVVPVLDELSLALDIDTEEEALDGGVDVPARS